ncbi:bidirectional sugar transporter SWEET1-like [Syzygium oleosum]|uniref:bidirectional sugar transporter SWEET1-like n=1 Tax=Syzygium oleosum TaxID=219896 RepID=UPI0024BB1320|nr:bidirectional sugar transporter SWEET1-like [Syzygium oleosum]
MNEPEQICCIQFIIDIAKLVRPSTSEQICCCHFSLFTFFSLAFDLGKAMDILRFLCGIIGNAIGLFLYLAPLTTFKKIIRSRSTEQFSGIPYMVTLLSCSLYTWYGLPFVSLDNLLLLIISGIGVVIELTYVLIFITYAPKKERAKIMGLSGLALVLFLTFAFVSLFALHGKARKLFCGITLVIFSTITYASPLSIMMLVIKTKSVEFMPFLLSLSSFLCGISWLAYGLLSRDPFLIVPNGLGTGLGIAQLILYAMYRKNQSRTKNEIRDEFGETDLEKTDQK